MKKALIKTILSGGKKLFVVALIVYLVGFLLEITFPGFVSNNFNLNWVLGVVLILGLLAALAPEEEESPFVKTTGDLRKADYLMFVGMGLIGGVLMFYRSDLNLLPRILFSVFVAVFITAVSLFLLLAKDEEEIVNEEETVEKTKPVKIKPVSVIVIGLICLFLGLGIFLIRSKKKPAEAPATTADQSAEEESLLLKQTPITILNGGAKAGSASTMAKFLQTKGFTIGRVADADNSNYKNAVIRFRPEEVNAARYLEEIIQETYPLVERAPLATDSAGIVLILGNPFML